MIVKPYLPSFQFVPRGQQNAPAYNEQGSSTALVVQSSSLIPPSAPSLDRYGLSSLHEGRTGDKQSSE